MTFNVAWDLSDFDVIKVRWYTRLTAEAALQALRERGVSAAQLPSASTMAAVLSRLGYRLRKVVKAKPLKKVKETDAIFENLKKNTPDKPRVLKQMGENT